MYRTKYPYDVAHGPFVRRLPSVLSSKSPSYPLSLYDLRRTCIISARRRDRRRRIKAISFFSEARAEFRGWRRDLSPCTAVKSKEENLSTEFVVPLVLKVYWSKVLPHEYTNGESTDVPHVFNTV